jgi:hypothetical protein
LAVGQEKLQSKPHAGTLIEITLPTARFYLMDLTNGATAELPTAGEANEANEC